VRIKKRKGKKMRKFLVFTLVALGVLATGCSKDEMNSEGNTGNGNEAGGNGSINITIKGESASARADRALASPVENSVKSFTVYVFNNATGVLEKSQDFGESQEGDIKGTIDGLSVVSQKRVVVLVNQPDGFPTIKNYSDFEEVSTMIALETQEGNINVKGLFMSGEHENPVKLSTTETVGITVTVKRVVAKVKLGSLTVTADDKVSLSDFHLISVGVQNVRDKASVFGSLDKPNTGFGYIGGHVLPESNKEAKTFLHDLYSLPMDYIEGTKLEPGLSYYVFPNDNSDGYATMLTLHGLYKTKPMYYSFLINEKKGSNGSTTDGKWIERNKIYTLNVLLKKLGSGGEDPDVPNEEVSMDVEIDVADWEGELVQEVEW